MKVQRVISLPRESDGTEGKTGKFSDITSGFTLVYPDAHFWDLNI